MSAWVRGLALFGLLALPAIASANGLRVRATQSYYYYYPVTSYYYAPAPVYAVECLDVRPTAGVQATLQPAPRATSEPAPAPRKYAQPSPAGPSSSPSAAPKTSEPPRNPGVSESRSYFSAYAVAPRTAEKPAGDRARVGFWNLSERDVVLTVANQAYSLPRGKSVRLDLPREFVWRVDSREAQNEKMPENESALEIVIRR